VMAAEEGPVGTEVWLCQFNKLLLLQKWLQSLNLTPENFNYFIYQSFGLLTPSKGKAVVLD